MVGHSAGAAAERQRDMRERISGRPRADGLTSGYRPSAKGRRRRSLEREAG